MSNNNYTHVTPELLERVRGVIAESVKHSYSVSRVYAAYNGAMQKKEQPQTCGSCLKRRVRELKSWLAEYENAQPAPVVESFELEGGGTITITDGKAKDEDGKGVAPGKYPTADGGTVVVAVGSKGRYETKAMPQYDDPGAPGYVPQVEGTVRYPMAEGTPFDFMPDEGTIVKGTVTRADGTPVEPGTYRTAEGLEIVVQSDGVTDIITPDDLV